MSNWMEIKALREEAQQAIARADAILETARKVEKRDGLNPDENAEFDNCHKIAEQKLELARQLERQVEAKKSVEERIGREEFEKPEPEAKVNQFERWLRYGERPETRAMTKGTANEGAEFVPEDFANRYEHYLRDLTSVIQAGAEVITTETGRDLPIPTFTDTANTGELIGEGTAAADAGADPDTDEVILRAYTFSSRVVQLSLQLVMDSGYPIEDALGRALAERVADVQNTYFTTGSGSGQPKGVVTCASDSGVTTSSTTAVTYNEMLSGIHGLPRQYRNGAKLMFNDSTLLALKKLVDGSGNSLWNAGNIGAGIPSTFDGIEYVINPKMSDMGAGNKFCLYGQFSTYKVRKAGRPEMLRFDDSAYMKALKIGFLLFELADGNCTNPNAIVWIDNAAS